MVEKPSFVLLSKLPILIRDHHLLNDPMVVGVSDVPRCINDVSKYLVLKLLYDGSVTLFRSSPQLYAVGPHRLQFLFVQHQLIVYRQGQYSSHEPIYIYIYLYVSPSSSRFFLTCAFQRSLASSVMPRYYGICDVKNS